MIFISDDQQPKTDNLNMQENFTFTLLYFSYLFTKNNCSLAYYIVQTAKNWSTRTTQY